MNLQISTQANDALVQCCLTYNTITNQHLSIDEFAEIALLVSLESFIRAAKSHVGAGAAHVH